MSTVKTALVALFIIIPAVFSQFQRSFTHDGEPPDILGAHSERQMGDQDMTRRNLVAGSCALLFVAPCMAHHSFGMFDQTRSVTLHGTVKELQWTNPHCFIQMLVTSENATREWSIELNSPALMYRVGWRPGSFRPGDELTVVLNPLRDGAYGGSLVSATDAGGKTWTSTGSKP